jgi:hypothetical protein
MLKSIYKHILKDRSSGQENLIHLLRSWVAGAHLACDFPRLLQATDDEYEPKEPFFGEDQPDD